MVPISDNSCGVRCTKYPDVSGVNKAVLVSYSLRMGLANTECGILIFQALGSCCLERLGRYLIPVLCRAFAGIRQPSSPFSRFSISQAYLTAWNQYLTLHCTYTPYKYLYPHHDRILQKYSDKFSVLTPYSVLRAKQLAVKRGQRGHPLNAILPASALFKIGLCRESKVLDYLN